MDPLFSAVEIEINHFCNRRCSYCPNSILARKSRGEIDATIFTGLMRELERMDFAGRISYDFYNEPLAHSDFERKVVETRAHLSKASIEVYTNGTLLTRERFDRLLEAGVSRFIVTRHEGEKDHLFAKVYRDLPETLRKQVVYRSFEQLALTNRGGTLRHLGAEGLPLAPCHIPSLVVTVTVSGNVLPCFEDFHENLVMGNLRDSTLREIWDSEKYRRFRKELRNGLRHRHRPCRDCNRKEALPPVV